MLVCDLVFNPLDLVLDGAFAVTPEATHRADLVSKAEIVSKRPFTLILHIRPDARWSDGVPVTASDFRFTYSALRRYLPDAPESQKIRGVDALDAKTVKVVLPVRFPDWRDFFPSVLPRHALTGMDLKSVWNDEVVDPRSGSPIGSGPFLVSGFERGKQLTLVRNPHYWGPHPAYLDRIVWRFVSPTDAAQLLRQGEVDMLDPQHAEFQEAARDLRQQRSPGIRVLSVPLSSWEHFDIRIGGRGIAHSGTRSSARLSPTGSTESPSHERWAS